MNVAAVIVTRGDVDVQPVLDSLPTGWEHVIWDNRGTVRIDPPDTTPITDAPYGQFFAHSRGDLAVYGRYAAIEHADADLIYVQDDDVIVSDPQAIVEAWQPGHVVCNMPSQFRHEGYTDSALVGFGACFERDMPAQAFDQLQRDEFCWPWGVKFTEHFYRTCDVVFTTLTPRILVDVPKADREFASDPNRMWKQPGHYAERTRMLQLARRVRDRVPA